MSSVQHTLSLLKPDVTRRNLTGLINSHIEEAGLQIIAQKRLWLTHAQAGLFYAAHKERAFFEDLCQFMCSGPIIAQVLEGANAISRYRTLMGATNPAQAAERTLRRDFALSVEENSVHGSDSPEAAQQEICFFFSHLELCPAQV